MIAILTVSFASAQMAEIPANVESSDSETIITFHPRRVSKLSLGVELTEVEVFGTSGKLKPVIEGDTLEFEIPQEPAEIRIKAKIDKKITVKIPKSESAAPKPPPDEKLKEVGAVKVTYYWVLLEEKFKGEADSAVLDGKGNEIGKFPKEFVKQLKIEGTGKLKDGRVINTVGSGRFDFVAAAYGMGVKGYHLIPFKSIAVDKSLIPIGSKIFIEEAVGAKLPDGSVHDGIFYAHDVGSGIKDMHIDIFTGNGDQSQFLERVGIRNLKKTKIYVVED